MQLAESDLDQIFADTRAGLPRGVTAAPAETVELLLTLVVNSTRTREMVSVFITRTGRISVLAGDLRAARIQIDPSIADDTLLDVASVSGLRATYRSSDQALLIDVPDSMLAMFEVNMARRATDPIDFKSIRQTPGLVLNYGVNGYTGRDATVISGDLEALAMTRVGVFSTSATWRAGSNNQLGNAFMRLDSTWRYVDPAHIRSYTAGDFASNAVYGASSVRLGGFQWASAFDQRPDIITAPMAQFAGSAALPSTIDVYLNSTRMFSTSIPSGPYSINAGAFLTGGAYRMVATDITGRQIALEQDVFYAPNQVRKGILQFSVDVGAPRRNVGLKSFDYDDTLFGSGSLRYGVSDRTTIEAHGQFAADGLVEIGGGVIQTFGRVASVTASLAGSTYDGYTGVRADINVRAQLGGIMLSAGTTRTSDDFFDLARLANVRAWKDAQQPGFPPLTNDWLLSTAQASAVDRAAVGFRPWFDKASSISASYSHVKTSRLEREMAGATWHRRLTRSLDLTVSGFRDFGRDRDYSVFATLNVRFNSSNRARVALTDNGGNIGYVTEFTHSGLGTQQGNLNWTLGRSHTEGGGDGYYGYAGYLTPFAGLTGQFQHSDGHLSGSAQIRGSLVLTGGSLFAANRIGNGFAVVKGAGPRSEIRQDGVPIARTNKAGSALLPYLQPYTWHRITADPTNLPDDWELPQTEIRAITAYRQGTMVDFRGGPVFGAVIVLHDARGEPIPLGSIARLETGEGSDNDTSDDDGFFVGQGGQVYVTGLKASNTLTVEIANDGVCRASFAYDAGGQAQPTIGPVTCQ